MGTEATVAVKPRRGAAVLDDLLREHFLGCAAVLVRGAVEAPLLEPLEPPEPAEPEQPEQGAWRLEGATLTTEELARRLGRPGRPEPR